MQYVTDMGFFGINKVIRMPWFCFEIFFIRVNKQYWTVTEKECEGRITNKPVTVVTNEPVTCNCNDGFQIMS